MTQLINKNSKTMSLSISDVLEPGVTGNKAMGTVFSKANSFHFCCQTIFEICSFSTTTVLVRGLLLFLLTISTIPAPNLYLPCPKSISAWQPGRAL